VSGPGVIREAGDAKWIERDLGDGVVERTYINSPARYSSAVGTCRVVGDGPTAPRVSAAPAKPKKSRRVPIRSMDGPACDVEVTLSDSVIESICRSVMWTTGVDGLEAGGFLAGIGLDKTLAVFDASGCNVKSKRGQYSLLLDLEDAEVIDKLRRSGDDLALVGNYHAHPTGDPSPSQTDFVSWEATHEYANMGGDWQPYTVGIIATPGENGRWASPTLHAWVTRDEGDRYVTRPARIQRI
jgi:proteasome lid subunit RPN8/RPN11